MFRRVRTFDAIFFLGHVHKYGPAEHVMTNHKNYRMNFHKITDMNTSGQIPNGTTKVIVLLTFQSQVMDKNNVLLIVSVDGF
jgi:hypothetical protein